MTMPSATVSTADIAGAVYLLTWLVLAWSALIWLIATRRRRTNPRAGYTVAVTVVLTGIVGQLGHLQEHVAQTGYWVAHSQDAPWMTPWGDGLARGFARLVSGSPALGMEVLHLVGNLIFLSGLVGIVLLTAPLPWSRARRWARMGVWMQGIHGLEHLTLTVSVALGAHRAIGLSTWFGILPPGPGLWTYRVWWHFLANVAGTVIFALALKHLWTDRHDLRRAYAPDPDAPELLIDRTGVAVMSPQRSS